MNSGPIKWNRETRLDTQSPLLAMLQFAFIIALAATQSDLAFTEGLSEKLQGPYVDVARVHCEIETVKAFLQGV